MGLDQWAVARTAEKPSLDENGYSFYEGDVRIGDWRKHANLQGFMERLWREKGGEGEFNCTEVELDIEDLENLEETIYGDMLPPTSGFFFGGGADDYYREADLMFINLARSAIRDGKKVIYNSWW